MLDSLSDKIGSVFFLPKHGPDTRKGPLREPRDHVLGPSFSRTFRDPHAEHRSRSDTSGTGKSSGR
jgi:hypothetical protein